MALLVTIATVQSQDPPEPRLDSEGDPLPVGAVARLGTLRFKHYPARDIPNFFRGPVSSTSRVSTAVFSADSKRIATIGQPGQNVMVWDAASGKELPGPWNSGEDFFYAQAIAISPDGSTLAGAGLRFDKNGGAFNAVVLWDIAGAKFLATMGGAGTPRAPTALAFDEAGKTLVAVEVQNRGRNETSAVVRWWDTATGKELRTWSPPVAKKSDPEDPNGKLETIYNYTFVLGPTVLAVRALKYESEDQKGYRQTAAEQTLYHLGDAKETGRVLHRASIKGIINSGGRAVAFSADGKRAAFVAASGTVELRDLKTGKLLHNLELNKLSARTFLSDICLSPDGKALAMANGAAQIALWSEDDPKAVRNIETQSDNAAQGLAFSPNGKMLVAGIGPDVRLYDLATLKEPRHWTGHRQAVATVAFSADGLSLRTGTALRANQDGDLITWDVASWKPALVCSRDAANKPAVGIVSPDHSVYIGKDPKDRLNVYHLATGKLMGRLSAPGNQNQIPFGFFAPSGTHYVLPGKDDAGKDIHRLYAIPSCKLVCQMPATGLVGNQRFIQPGMFIEDTDRPVVFSADGRVAALFAREDGRIFVFETATGKLKYRLGRPQSKEDEAPNFGQLQGGRLELSPDGQLLASWIASENRVRIYDLKSGNERQPFPRDDAAPTAVRFAWSPDGRTLALVKGQNIQLWEVASLRVRKELSGHFGEILALAFSPDGRQLATAGADTTVLIWDTRGR
jgi:WD40 repeat protein